MDTQIQHLESDTHNWEIEVLSGSEFINDHSIMVHYWAYLKEYTKDMDLDLDRSVNRLHSMDCLVIADGHKLVGFAFAIPDKGPKPLRDFFIGELYVTPEYRSLKFLLWFRHNMDINLGILGFDTWTITLPIDEEKRIRAYTKLGWEFMGEHAGHAMMIRYIRRIKLWVV